MPRTARPISLARLAEFLGCALQGDGSILVHGFGSLEQASEDELVPLKQELRRYCPVSKVISQSGTAIIEEWTVTHP